MLTAINTITDYQKLPSTIRHIISGGKGKVSKAEKSHALQNAVAVSVCDRSISLELAVKILITNGAYGKRGKAVLEEIIL